MNYFLCFLLFSSFLLACNANPFGSGTCYAVAGSISMNRSKKPTENGGFTLTSSSSSYSANDRVELTLAGSSTNVFAGFLLYAENEKGDRVGSFDASFGSEIHFLKDCPGDASATLTHSSSFDSRAQIKVTWLPGSENHGKVEFRVVVLSGQRQATGQTFYWPSTSPLTSTRGSLPTPPPIASDCNNPIVVTETCPELQQGAKKWSEWQNKPTQVDANVTIARDEIIILDVTPPLLNKVEILGQLVFDPSESANIKLTAKFIYVRACGRLFIGAENCPALGQYEVVLDGEPAYKVDPDGFGTKVLAGFPGSHIDIHGRPVNFAWTQLGQTAGRLTSKIVLAEEPIGWVVGDEVVVATTSYNEVGDATTERENERRTITAIEGKVLTLNRRLDYTHYGLIYTPDGAPAEHAIDMRAEVGLLSRNIHLRGSDRGDSAQKQWGGHIMVLGSAQLRVENAELYDMGQAGELARYPIHFHVTGRNPKSYVKTNSIHDTYQRCVTVHGTDELLVQGNAAYNNNGHCYFVEDGNERHNVFDRNLGIAPQKHSLLKSDSEPAVFWITHPTNHFFENHAVGGTFGYWYAPPLHPTGKARNPDTDFENWPRHAPMGEFRGNVAHSATNSGFFFDRGLKDDAGNVDQFTAYFPSNVSAVALELQKQALAGTINEMYAPVIHALPLAAHVVDFTAFKCKQFGLWGRGQRLVVTNAKLADNQIGASVPDTLQIVTNSVFYGKTTNNPDEFLYEWFKDMDRVGYQSYDTGVGNSLLHSHFYDFTDVTGLPSKTNGYRFNGVHRFGAITTQTGPNTLPPMSLFVNNTFTRVSNRVLYQRYAPDFNGNPDNLVDMALYDISVKGRVIVDDDGTLTGDQSLCGAAICGQSPLLRHTDAGCSEKTAWRAWICTKGSHAHFGARSYSEVAVAIDDQPPSWLNIQRLGDGAKETFRPYPEGGAYPCGNTVCQSSAARWNTNLLSGYEYTLSVGNNRIMKQFEIGVAFRFEGEKIRVAIGVANPPKIVVYKNEKSTVLAAASSKATLSTTNPWYHDSSKGILWLHLEGGANQPQIISFPPVHRVIYEANLLMEFQCDGNEIEDINKNKAFCPVTDLSATPASPVVGNNVGTICGHYDQVLTFNDDASVTPYVIYDDSFAAGWAFEEQNGYVPAIEQSKVALTGSKSILTQMPDLSFEFIDPNDGRRKFELLPLFTLSPVQLADFTHLRLSVRLAEGFGAYGMNIAMRLAHGPDFERDGGRIFTLGDPKLGKGTVINTNWQTYYVPLDYVLAGASQLQKIYIFHFDARPIEFYIDDVKLIKATSQSIKANNDFLFEVPPSAVPQPELVYNEPTPYPTTAPASTTTLSTTTQGLSTANTLGSTTAVQPSSGTPSPDTSSTSGVVLDTSTTTETGNVSEGPSTPSDEGCTNLHEKCSELCVMAVKSCECKGGQPAVVCKDTISAASPVSLAYTLIACVVVALLSF